MAKRHVEGKFKQAWALAGRLPAVQQKAFRARLSTLQKSARASTVGAEVPHKPTDPDDLWEWDLKFANELDKLYTAVSDRVSQVAKQGGEIVKATADTAASAASSVGWGIWPLALAAGFVLLSFAKAKR